MANILYDAIDVSKHQGTVNWDNVKNAGISHVMIRAGYGRYSSQTDPQFERNVRECEKRGIHWGAYWYSYATSTTQAQQEANVFLSVMRGKKPDMPLAYDIEYEPGILALSDSTRTQMVKAFLNKVEAAGYYGMLYASKDFIQNYLNYNELKAYDVWCAQYGSSCTCPLPYGIWQYSSKNALGIPGYGNSLDCNHVYKDYPTIIKNAGLNGWGKPNEDDGDKNIATNMQLITIGPITGGDVTTIKNLCVSLQLVSQGLYKESNGTLTIGPVSSGDACLIMKKCEDLDLVSRGYYKSKYV